MVVCWESVARILTAGPKSGCQDVVPGGSDGTREGRRVRRPVLKLSSGTSRETELNLEEGGHPILSSWTGTCQRADGYAALQAADNYG